MHISQEKIAQYVLFKRRRIFPTFQEYFHMLTTSINAVMIVIVSHLRTWRNGRRAALRGQWGYPRGGSTPLVRILI